MKRIFLFLSAAALLAASIAVAGDIVHVVKKGETLSAISKKYHVPVNDIIKRNNLASAGAIKIGQKLKIPGKQTASAKPKPAPAKPAPAAPIAVQAAPEPAPAVETAAMDTILPEVQPETLIVPVPAAPVAKKSGRMSTKTKFFILFVVQTIVSALLSYLIALWIVNRNSGGYKRGA